MNCMSKVSLKRTKDTPKHKLKIPQNTVFSVDFPLKRGVFVILHKYNRQIS